MAKAAHSTKKGGASFSISGLIDVLASGRESLDAMEDEVRIRVHVGAECPRELILAAKEALSAQRAGGVVEVMGLSMPVVSAAAPDAAVVLAAAHEDGLRSLLGAYLAESVPCALVVETLLDTPSLDEEGCAGLGLVCASDAEALGPKLAEWLTGVVSNPIALAANFPFCRDAAVNRLAARCAAENAAIGAISLIPGSDYPIMCANQAKLALDIAACYGNGIEPSRALEVAGVFGAGLAYRAAARAAAGFVPGLGFALKAAMGYAGTVATAKAVQARFSLTAKPAMKSAGERGGAREREGCLRPEPLPETIVPVNDADTDQPYVLISEDRSKEDPE